MQRTSLQAWNSLLSRAILRSRGVHKHENKKKRKDSQKKKKRTIGGKKIINFYNAGRPKVTEVRVKNNGKELAISTREKTRPRSAEDAGTSTPGGEKRESAARGKKVLI